MKTIRAERNIYDLNHFDRRSPKSLALKIIVALLLFIAALALIRGPLLHKIEALSLFRIENVPIEGCSRSSRADIRALLENGDSMLSISTSDLKARIRQVPWVKAVTVDKVWPDELKIVVTEYKPVALMIVDGPGGGRLAYVDRGGHIFADVQSGDDIDFPVITGLNGMLQEEREKVMGDILFFLRYINSSDKNLSSLMVSELHYSVVEGLVVWLVDDPFPIYFGEGDVHRKYIRLRSILADAYSRKSDRIQLDTIRDLRLDYSGSNGDALITRKKTEEKDG